MVLTFSLQLGDDLVFPKPCPEIKNSYELESKKYISLSNNNTQ
jgi:hypothetical protein